MANICVTGSRTWIDVPLLELVLGHYLLASTGDHALHVGDARGADAIAQSFAQQNGKNVRVYRADWDTLGRSAGIRRNVQMLAEAKPRLLLAFRVGPSSRGTDHCISEARARNIPTIVIQGLE